MKNLTLLVGLAAAFLTLASSCDKEEPAIVQTAAVDLQFTASFEGAPLVMFQPYDYRNNQKVYFTRFSFYLSDLSLKSEAGGLSKVTDIKYIDFSAYKDAAAAASGYTYQINGVPVGKYSGAEMAIGVPADLNRTTPAAYAATHPLAETSEYWSGWKSYIFFKVEGVADLDGDGTFEQPIVYHGGTDDLLKTVQVSGDYDINEGLYNLVHFDFDLKKLLISSTEYVDIEKYPSDHDIMVVASFIAGHWTDAVTLK